ncbi:MAG: HD domain-containing protein [Acidobacteriaceae bacterium]|nr:HD domain-containing protein [Acidobacteriaceae bacterium]
MNQSQPSTSQPDFRLQTNEIISAFRRDRNAFGYLEARTRLVDSAVQSAVSDHLQPKLNSKFAMTAVGGYGRRELFPHSDVDLLLLFETEQDLADSKDALSDCWRVLWDAGLRISHSVRTISECCRLNDQNTELHISLLDSRFVAGDSSLFVSLSTKLPEFYARQGSTLTRRLAEMTRQRHTKFNSTVYHLEPNIKEAPGGIRDIHLLRWLSQLNPQHQAITESLTELDGAREFLFAIRCLLHAETGRDNNLLTFELQDRVAELLPPKPAIPEAWMRQYYASARQIFQPVLRALDHVEAQDPSLLRQIRDMRSRYSTSEFTVSRDRVYLRNAPETLRSADSLFALFTFVARHGLKLSWDAQRRLRSSSHQLEAAIREHPPARQSWRELLSQPNTALALREMQETGFLGIAIPEWLEIDSLVVRDFYHRYTVDEHTLVAIEAIDQLLANKQGTPKRFHDLAEEEDDHAVLRFALLLHDIGKGTMPGDHVRGSLEAAEAIMTRMLVPANKRQEVKFLIEHHLDLSQVMNGRDLEDPATARHLTARVGTQERLRRLALLTYADISAVNPTAMTPWRLEQLWRVYSLGLEQLTRDLVMDRIHAGPQVTAALTAEASQFVEGLPTRYLRTHSPDEIRRHFTLYKTAIDESVGVEIVRETGAYVLSVVARDEPGLFAALCGGLASFGMNIVKAEAFSNASGYIVDVIRFADPMRTLELNPGEVDRLQWTLQCVVRGSIEVFDLLKRRRPVRIVSTGARIAPRVRFNNEASDHSTLIDFVGEDRPGLLYDLASVLKAHGCDIEVVLIDTEAHKAIDVFYVTCSGEKLTERVQDELGRELVKAGMRT